MLRRVSILALALVGRAAFAQETAQKEYDLSYVGFLEAIDEGVVQTRWYQGKYHRFLEDDAGFLDAVDRPDLARELRRKSALQNELGLPGGLLMILGGATAMTAGLMWAVQVPCTIRDMQTNTCNTSGVETWTWIGLGSFGAGLGLVIAAASIHVPTLSNEEAHQLAEEHNQRLRERLGLPSEDKPRHAARPTISVDPQLGATGGGLSLRLTF